MLHALTITRSYCFPPSLLAHCLAFWHLYWRLRQDVSRHNRVYAENVDYLYLKSCFMLLYSPLTAPPNRLALDPDTPVTFSLSPQWLREQSLTLSALRVSVTEGFHLFKKCFCPCMKKPKSTALSSTQLEWPLFGGLSFCACPSTCGLALKKPSVSVSWVLKDGIHME